MLLEKEEKEKKMTEDEEKREKEYKEKREKEVKEVQEKKKREKEKKEEESILICYLKEAVIYLVFFYITGKSCSSIRSDTNNGDKKE